MIWLTKNVKIKVFALICMYFGHFWRFFCWVHLSNIKQGKWVQHSDIFSNTIFQRYFYFILDNDQDLWYNFWIAFVTGALKIYFKTLKAKISGVFNPHEEWGIAPSGKQAGWKSNKL